ncbi:MAG: hypothetical protein AB1Z23_10050 [Eubacteriales bacterium]
MRKGRKVIMGIMIAILVIEVVVYLNVLGIINLDILSETFLNK